MLSFAPSPAGTFVSGSTAERWRLARLSALAASIGEDNEERLTGGVTRQMAWIHKATGRSSHAWPEGAAP